MYRHITDRYIGSDAEFTVHGKVITYEISPSDLVAAARRLYHEERLPLKIITASDERDDTGMFRIHYVFGVPGQNLFLAPFVRITSEYPSLTPIIHEASLYERKIKSFFGLLPVGHPDPRSLILHENWPEGEFPLRKDFGWDHRPDIAEGNFAFRQLHGEGIYEIPVGPVHAGIIEPGHFRFSVAGEEILLLEPRLGYSHKGSEKLFEVLRLADKVKLSERVSGDSSFSHALAFCQALEVLGDITVSDRDQYLRVIFAELERIANHFGDIGAIMTDTGFNWGGAYGARLRETVLQVHERLTGSRFLRGVMRIGGVNAGLTATDVGETVAFLDHLRSDFSEVMAVAQNSSSLLNRLENTGRLDQQIAEDHGIVGVAARAVGIRRDARADYPYAAYDRLSIEIATEHTNDVRARFFVRVKEVFAAMDILKAALRDLPAESLPIPTPSPIFRKSSCSVGIVEGWRGEIMYWVATDPRGEITRVDVRDPSFLNWSVLGHAGRENMVPDFPLINKSFNLSYSGNDL